jgi:hypothetical protein
MKSLPPPSPPLPPAAFEHLSPEGHAVQILSYREHGHTSVDRLEVALDAPFKPVEGLLCRGLSTLASRRYPVNELCTTYRVTPEQLGRAATTAPFLSGFRAIGEGQWQDDARPTL